jgi:hypothetical protein
MEENSSPPEQQNPRREPADEIEIKKSIRSIRRALSNFWNEVRRRRNKNALWKF